MTKKSIPLGATSFVASFIFATALTFAVGSLLVQESSAPISQKAENPKRTLGIPFIVSSVPSIEIVTSPVFEPEFADRIVKLRALNRSDKSIAAFSVECGNDRDTDGFSTINGSYPIAGANEEFTIVIPIGNFSTAMPIRLSAIVFDDGSAEGEKDAKLRLRDAWLRSRSIKSSQELFHF